MCVCQWNDDGRVVSMCGAHHEAARREYASDIAAVEVAKELGRLLTLEQWEKVSRPTVEWLWRRFGIK